MVIFARCSQAARVVTIDDHGAVALNTRAACWPRNLQAVVAVEM